MTISTSPSLAALQAEYGGGYPIYLTNYRRGIHTPAYAWGNGGYGVIPDTAGNYTDLGVFRNRQCIRITIGGHANDVNIRNLAGSYGYNGSSAVYVEVTINPGVYVFGSSTGAIALRTGGSFAAGSSIYIINQGYIVGRGGAGGAGSLFWGANGEDGGPAFVADDNCIINNQGIIAGGGGGGGGGGANAGTIVGSGGGGGRVHGAGGAGFPAGVGGDYNSAGAGGYYPATGRGGDGGQVGADGGAGSPYSYVGGSGGLRGYALQNSGAIAWANYGDVRGRTT